MKDKAFILDFNLLAEQNLSINEFLVLIHLKDDIIYNDSMNVLKPLEEKQFIKIISNDKIILREKGKIFIELILIENVSSTKNTKRVTKSDRLINVELDSFINDFRNKFKGLKPGSMGSEASCKLKMYRWMKENPSYTPEQILKAAEIYIKSLNNYQYLQQADYFIYKKEGREEQSKLSAFIDEIETDDDWTTNLK
jgi:hypothetical protein